MRFGSISWRSNPHRRPSLPAPSGRVTPLAPPTRGASPLATLRVGDGGWTDPAPHLHDSTPLYHKPPRSHLFLHPCSVITPPPQPYRYTHPPPPHSPTCRPLLPLSHSISRCHVIKEAQHGRFRHILTESPDNQTTSNTSSPPTTHNTLGHVETPGRHVTLRRPRLARIDCRVPGGRI